MREHPAEGVLQALIDGELPAARFVLVRAHLLRCESCRARVDATRDTAALVNTLLRRSTPTVDSASAWERLLVRSGGRAERARRAPPRWTSAVALALATAAIAITMVRGTARPAPGEDAFALVRQAQAHPAMALLRDACCSDHDGGDQPDDGLLTLSTVGETVTVVIVYEDVDHSATFTHGDIVRYVSTMQNAAWSSKSAP